MELLAGLSYFWVGVVVTLGFLAAIISTATRSYWLATAFVIGTIAVSHATAFSLLDWILVNWITVAIYFSVYVAIGLAWATFAWFLHLNKLANRYDAARKELLPTFLKSHGLDELTPEYHEAFRLFISKTSGDLPSTRQLTMSTSVMIGQVILWPFKAIGFFLGDAITWIVTGFLSLFGGFFTRIQKWVFRKFPELQV